jgi:L-ascorbate metabolism protein UlaG (beta-lactamase superfamily)
MLFTYYGHSCFSVEIKGKNLLFDPFITHNPLATGIDVQSIPADFILISHGHFDHISDAVAIASRTGAKVIANWEIYEWLGKQGITNVHPMNTGGKAKFDFGDVKCVTAQHSSGLPDGAYGGNPLGFIITSDDGNFYYSGDTALTLDMQLIPRWAKLEFAVMPIGDNFTMDAADAASAAEMVQCKQVVGVHYDTFGFIRISKEQAVELFSEKGIKLLLPDIGETINIK